MDKKEIKNSITYKQRKKTAIKLNILISIYSLLMIGGVCFAAIIVSEPLFIIPALFVVFLFILPVIILGVILIKKCTRLLKNIEDIKCYEVNLGTPVEENFVNVKFAFHLNNKSYITEWTSLKYFNPPYGYSDDEFKHKIFIVGFYNDDEFILIKEKK